MKIIEELEQGSQAWHDYRLSKIGGSECPIICGISPHRSPYSLWLEKMGLYTQEVTSAMQRGTDMEPVARKRFNEQYGKFTPAVVEHDTIPWMSASLDGIDIHHKCLLEIKCTSAKNHSRMKMDDIPLSWMYQVQHQLIVTGCQWGYLASYYDDDLAVKRIMPDPKIQEIILAKEKEFWGLLNDFTPPPLTDMDIIKRDDPEWIAAASEYKDTQVRIRELEGQEMALRDKLVKLSKGHNSAGGGIRLVKLARKGNIDYSVIPALQDMDLNPYRKPTTEHIRITKS